LACLAYWLSCLYLVSDVIYNPPPAAKHLKASNTEEWMSGLSHHPGKVAQGLPCREFESRLFRQGHLPQTIPSAKHQFRLNLPQCHGA
jgi:hypothetical protein